MTRIPNKHRNTWTEQEDLWIIENHPHLGHKLGYAEFCKIFGDRHPVSAYKTRTSELKVKVTPERWRNACKNNGQHDNVPVGTIKKRGRGQNWIKVSDGTDGWVPLARYLMKPNCNQIVVHINGDKSDDRLENLRLIERKISARMSKQNMWSECSEITETALILCELQQCLKEGDEK